MQLQLGIAEQDDAPRALTWAPVSLEAEILTALDAPPLVGEQLAAAFRREEIVLGTLFAQLDVCESRALHRRLVLSLPGDPITA
jgi:hypothetical protein